jgi:hypothetical protein
MMAVKNALLCKEYLAERKMMDTTVCLAAGPKIRCYTMSPKVAVQWDSAIVYCGFKTAYKLSLSGVAGKTMAKISCRTNEGRLLDESELHISSTIYMGRMLIPFNVAAGTNIYIEILLPEYGVLSKSVCKPVHNSIPMKAMYIKNTTCNIAIEDLRGNLSRKTSSFRSERMSKSKVNSFLSIIGWSKQLLNVYLKFINCF